MTRHIITLTITGRSGAEMVRDILPMVEGVTDWESVHIEEVSLDSFGDERYLSLLTYEPVEAGDE